MQPRDRQGEPSPAPYPAPYPARTPPRVPAPALPLGETGKGFGSLAAEG